MKIKDDESRLGSKETYIQCQDACVFCLLQLISEDRITNKYLGSRGEQTQQTYRNKGGLRIGAVRAQARLPRGHWVYHSATAKKAQIDELSFIDPSVLYSLAGPGS